MSWGCVSCFASPIDPLYHAGGGFGDPDSDFAMSPVLGSMRVVYDGKLPTPKPLPTGKEIAIIGSAEWKLPSTQLQDFGHLLNLRAKRADSVQAMVVHVLGYRPALTLPPYCPVSCVQCQ